MKIKFEGEGGVVSEQPRRFIEHWTLLSLPSLHPAPTMYWKHAVTVC